MYVVYVLQRKEGMRQPNVAINIGKVESLRAYAQCFGYIRNIVFFRRPRAERIDELVNTAKAQESVEKECELAARKQRSNREYSL